MSVRPFIAAFLFAMIAFGATERPQRVDAVPFPPTMTTLDNGTVLTTFGTTLRWTYPSGSVTHQVHLQVVPFNNDGAAIDVILDASNPSFNLPAPPDWFGMLPDVTYTWRLRGSEAATSIGVDDPSWGPRAPVAFKFRTPKVTTADVFPLTPTNGTSANTTPTLVWKVVNEVLFYFEIQLSADPNFNSDPATATASVYWNLVRGAVTNPPNSYTVPASAPLQAGRTYYRRVRPRGRGTARRCPGRPRSSSEPAAPRARRSTNGPAMVRRAER